VSIARKLGFTLITVAVAIVILEGGARLVLALWGPGAAPLGAGWETKLYRPDPRLFWRFHPGLDVEESSDRMIDVRTNSLGLRGGEIAPRKSSGTLRILALGDSCTFGQGARTDEAYPERLRQILAGRRPDLTIEVLNAGVPGYSSYQTRRQLEGEGFALEPDVVVIAVGFNDTGDARPTKRRSFAGQLLLSDAEYARAVERSNRFGVLRLAYRLRGTSGGGDDDAESGGPIDKPRVAAGEYRSNLEAMIDASRARGILPVMLVWPYRYQAAGLPSAGRWEAVTAYQGIARDVARARGIPLVDGVDLVRAREDYFFDSVHFNPAGYAAVAQALADALSLHPPLGPAQPPSDVPGN
jgi:lysophospholipase L1-like esterase